MNIFDIFSFKKQAQQFFTKENISNLIGLAKNAIISQVKENITGSEKKAAVDAIVLVNIDKLSCGVTNGIVLWLIQQLKNFVPTITQFIYDLLKEKVENL